MPKIISANIVAIFWAFIFGEVIGYIASALELMPYNALEIGITAALTAFIAVNGIFLISKVSQD
ncbi:DUF2929 domain-containing protein [Lentilactobacillus curieae]|uniref:DUF2929 domain-containing protein n=1 Tax=Lentilactobacillus curieae TaxID=1138822 RepID=A0A1S6QKI8_9LACO|nr:DUF2929 family protein [Lentilactobacillus curieae]AQW22109.1 DUF2929 domain-containing protein [Lentilactobacillus curieae]